MAENKKISQFTQATAIQDSDKIPLVRGNSNLYGNWQTFRNNVILNLKTITSDYSIQSTDRYTHIDISHSSTSALIEIDLPKLSTYTGPPIKITNAGSDNGLSHINKNSLDSANILFNNEVKSTIKLYMRGNSLFLRSNGTYWIVEDYNINIEIGWQNRSDWTNVHMGSSVTYNTKSAAVDWTGKKFSGNDGSGTNTCICLYDSGGTGSSGELHFYAISGSLGYFVDGNTLTASDGSGTSLVNEVTSSKNKDKDLYHGFNLDILSINKKLIVHDTASFVGSFEIDKSYTTHYGWILFEIDANTVQFQTGQSGMDYVDTNGASQPISTNDWYFNIILTF